MDEPRSLSGHCLCGDERVLAQAVSRRVGVCHCGMCRSWSGGPLLAVDCGTEVSFEGADRIGTMPRRTGPSAASASVVVAISSSG